MVAHTLGQSQRMSTDIRGNRSYPLGTTGCFLFSLSQEIVRLLGRNVSGGMREKKCCGRWGRFRSSVG